jgi:hypothetical protein
VRVYREKAEAALADRLELVREGGEFDLSFRLPAPVNYEREYTTAIAMVEWEVEPEIELSDMDFKRYVLDQWEWGQVFAANTRSYLAA